MEIYVRSVADDGLQFDLEMWKYSRQVKRLSNNPKIGHEHKPNVSAKLMGVQVTTNGDGLRDGDYSFDKNAGSKRILMLGDSVTFGWGASQDKTFSKILENEFRRNGKSVDVINTGVGNYNTSMEVEYFFEKGFKYKPDIVILNYFINDAEPTPAYKTNFLERNSKVYVFFAGRYDVFLRRLGIINKPGWEQYYSSLYSPENKNGLDAVSSSIRKLSEYCNNNNIKLIVVNIPELRVLNPYPFPFADKFLSDICNQLKIPSLSLLPYLSKYTPESLWVTKPDPHPSELAHEVIGKAIFKYVSKYIN